MKRAILIIFLMFCFSLSLYGGSQDTISYRDTVYQVSYDELISKDSIYFSLNSLDIFYNIRIDFIYKYEITDNNSFSICSNTVWDKMIVRNPCIIFNNIRSIEDIEYDKLIKKIEESDFKDPIRDSTRTEDFFLSITIWDGKFMKTYNYNLPEKYELLKEMFCSIKPDRVNFCEIMTDFLSDQIEDVILYKRPQDKHEK